MKNDEELLGPTRKKACKLDGFKPSSFGVALAGVDVYDLEVVEGGVLRRQLRKPDLQGLVPPAWYPSRVREA